MKTLVLLNVLLPDRGGCLKINDGGKKKKKKSLFPDKMQNWNLTIFTCFKDYIISHMFIQLLASLSFIFYNHSATRNVKFIKTTKHCQ